MKKKLVITISIFVGILALFISTGFVKCTDVFLSDYTLSEDGSTMTLYVQRAGSLGYIRACNINRGGDNFYISFYQTFGGLNSTIGAQNTFEIPLNSLNGEIYFYHGDGGYTLVLQKDEATGEWHLPY